MCGIVAYVGNGRCRQFILDGLARLEYRGYDSAGLVCIDQQHGHFSYHKEAGGTSPVKRLSQTVHFDGPVGVGHTRWATHGVVDESNAHPHFNCDKSLAVVHNGIIEHHEALKERLLSEGHAFTSTTDTEVVAHLMSAQLTECHEDVLQAALQVARVLHGAYGLIFLYEKMPDVLILMRRRAPLVIGIGEGEAYVASDLLAFSHKTGLVSFVPDESVALVKKDSIEYFSLTGKPLPSITQQVDAQSILIDKHDFEHYMLKEIYEQKRSIVRTISFFKIVGNEHQQAHHALVYDGAESGAEQHAALWRQMGLSVENVRSLKTLHLVAAGTSWHASRIAQYFFEEIAKIPTRVHLASEFRYSRFFPEDNTLFIFTSQSGETADTLEALRLVNTFSLPTLALTNVAFSTIVREAAGFLPMQAGPEISVASTKAFSTQVASFYWLAYKIAYEKGLCDVSAVKKAEEDLFVAAEILESVLDTYKLSIIQKYAPLYARYDKFIFLGRHISYPFAMEAALKLKEISYIFAQCYPAGELKHGPIALIDQSIPVVIFSVLDEAIYRKLLVNAQEVKARRGHLIVFAFEGQKEILALADTSFTIPVVPALLGTLAMTGLMQFFVYQITCELGLPIDKPRNLAKSVTVE